MEDVSLDRHRVSKKSGILENSHFGAFKSHLQHTLPLVAHIYDTRACLGFVFASAGLEQDTVYGARYMGYRVKKYAIIYKYGNA